MAAILTALSPAGVQRALAASDGSFQFKNLPSGSYSICAQAPSPIVPGQVDDYLVDGCEWLSCAEPRLALAAATTLNNAAITLVRGQLVTIRVNDPQRRLLPPVGRHSANDLMVHMASPTSLIHRIPIASMDVTSRTFTTVIPYGTPHGCGSKTMPGR